MKVAQDTEIKTINRQHTWNFWGR